MQIKKTFITCLLGFWAAGSIFGQQASLLFPSAGGKEMNLYYFSGAHADTLTLRLNEAGKGVFKLPQKDYRGIIVLGSDEFGLVELILAEALLEVEVHADKLNIQTAEVENSAENTYLKKIFSEQGQLMQQLEWLKQGEVFHASLAPALVAQLKQEKEQTQQAVELSRQENSRSPLFAARYYEAVAFLNRLYEAEQKAYSQDFQVIKAEMEAAGMIPVMYRSGNMWLQMQNRYISLFNRIQGLPHPRLRYAESVTKILSRLQAPYYEGFLAGSITETERFGWLEARDSILAYVVGENPRFTTAIPSLQRSLSAFLMRHEGIAPGIAGLPVQKTFEKTLLAFHDSDCNSCLNEMQTLARRYEHLKKNKIRVVSIAADKSRERFKTEVRQFPWTDRLCDFQGFEGVNFATFGVVATPTFFVISKDGKIEGEFNDTNEAIGRLLKEQSD